jgi:hypothetical protein
MQLSASGRSDHRQTEVSLLRFQRQRPVQMGRRMQIRQVTCEASGSGRRGSGPATRPYRTSTSSCLDPSCTKPKQSSSSTSGSRSLITRSVLSGSQCSQLRLRLSRGREKGGGTLSHCCVARSPSQTQRRHSSSHSCAGHAASQQQQQEAIDRGRSADDAGPYSRAEHSSRSRSSVRLVSSATPRDTALSSLGRPGRR